jgi:succinoglycan biosynthesis transport protein ExoP
LRMDTPHHAEPSPAPEFDIDSAAPGFDYRHFLHYLIEKFWIVVLCLLAGTFLGIGYLHQTPKLYQSRLVLEVDVQQQRIAPVEGVQAGNFQSLEQLRTIEQNLRNRTLMDRIVRATDLVHNRDFLPPTEDGKPYSESTLASVLTNMVNPVVRRGTRLIDVFVTHTDPKVAQMLADSVGREYILESIKKRTDTAGMAYDFLRREAEVFKEKLKVSENELQAYREAKGSVSLDERENIVTSKLKDLSTRVTQLKADRLRLQADVDQIEKFSTNPDRLMTIPSIANHPTVVEIRNQITNVNAGIANLAQRYKDKHPKMIQARSQLEEIRKNLREAVLRLPPLLKSEYENSIATEKNLQNALAEQETAALDLNKQTIPYNELQRRVDADKALYESVLKRANETDLTKGIQADPVQIVEAATFSPLPVSPLPMKTMVLAVLGGLAAGVGLVFLLHTLDRSIKTVDQAEHFLGLPVLAAVPDMKFPPQKSYLLMIKDPDSTASEAFRSLRASVSLLGPEIERKVLVFTSALPSEGKSFSATNYAISLAQQGHKTLLIDADLRRPTIHKIFEIDPALPGLTDFLVGRGGIKETAHACEVEHLLVMPGGKKAPNPAELLSGRTFAEMVSEFTRTFDRVVIDSAPILAVSDTLLMTPFIQSVCLVVRSNKTPRNAVRRAISLLDQVGSHPVGLVLNRLPKRGGRGYYYYYTEHGYGDGVYGSKPEPQAANKA